MQRLLCELAVTGVRNNQLSSVPRGMAQLARVSSKRSMGRAPRLGLKCKAFGLALYNALERSSGAFVRLC